MVAVVLVALSVDPTDPNPKGTYALIFGIVGAYVFLLLAIQRLDIEAAARQRARPSIAPGTTIDNPMTVPEPDLWAALATGPIGDQAIRAHGLAWGLVRKSNNTAWIVCVLIFTCVPMTYMLESFVPVLVGAALIVLVSIAYLVGLAGAGGGELQDAYDAIDVPTLLLRGTASDVLPASVAEEMTRRGPKPRLVVFPDCGHAPTLASQEEIALLRDFLAG